jgi:type II secretory pathway component PulC
MKIEKRKIIVYSLLPLAIIFAMINFFPADKGPKSKTVKNEVPKAGAKVLAPIKNQIDIEKYADLNWGRDPFTFKNKTGVVIPVEPPPEWKLGGILYDENSPSAIVNKKIISKGDTIDGATVVEINESSVTLESNGVLHKLTL